MLVSKGVRGYPLTSKFQGESYPFWKVPPQKMGISKLPPLYLRSKKIVPLKYVGGGGEAAESEVRNYGYSKNSKHVW